MRLFFSILLLIAVLNGCSSTEIGSPCPDYGNSCSKTPINSWDYEKAV